MAGAANPALYSEVIVLLGSAVIAAPLFKKLGFGTVLGYLAAGVVIGPILRFIADTEEFLEISELGVVFLLFIIGLELKPSRLWALRRHIFGLGFAQVVLSAIAIGALAAFLLDQQFAAAAVIGSGLALSSTAFALQILEERGEMNRRHGQNAFAILLFQDLAIVPLLALLPLLASGTEAVAGSGLMEVGKAVAAVIVLVGIGRYALNPLFRIIGNTGAREAMSATALLIVIGSAVLMQAVGLSMAMGAFIAGVMLAESSYRHELEADIEPFRGLLLGLFFMAIGMELNLSVIADNWLLILAAVPVLMAAKFAVVYGLCRLFKTDHAVAMRTAAILPQGGEFGFVLFSAAVGYGILERSTASLLIAIVTVSMALTPLVVVLANRLIPAEKSREMDEDYSDLHQGSDVLMIGFSRFGQIAAQMLLSGGVNVTVIDNSADRIEAVRKFGFRIYYGDGARKDVLEAAGIRRSKIVAVTTHKKEITDHIVNLIQSEYPDVRLFVRSYDRLHTLDLLARGVEYELRETFESGLLFGQKTLVALGTPDDLAYAIKTDVRKRDAERLRIQANEGIHAGRHMMHTRPVNPEPLLKPQKESEVIDMRNVDNDAAE